MDNERNDDQPVDAAMVPDFDEDISDETLDQPVSKMNFGSCQGVTGP